MINECRRLIVSLAAYCACLGLLCSGSMAFAQEADPPYFCGNAAMTPSPVEQAICADKRLHVLYAALEFELEDAMTQAVGADKLNVLERIKREHPVWEESLPRQCSDSSTLNSCVRSAYETRRLELAALLRASGLRSMSTVHAQEPDSIEPLAESAPKPPVPAPATTAPRHTQAQAAAPAQDATPEPAAPAKSPTAKDGGTPWSSVFIGLATIAFAAWWIKRSLLGSTNVKSGAIEASLPAPTGAEGTQSGHGTSLTPASKDNSRWLWGLAVFGVMFLVIRQNYIERTSKAIASANAFPSGAWQCDFLGRIEFHKNGKFTALNPAENPQSDNILLRVAHKTTGDYFMQSGVLTLNSTRVVSEKGSPQDMKTLGRFADMSIDGVRKYDFRPEGQDVVLVERYNAVNGKARPVTQKSFVCHGATPTQTAAETTHADDGAQQVQTAPAPQPVALTKAQAEHMAAMHLIQRMRQQNNPVCSVLAQQMEHVWGFYQGGQAHFKDVFFEVAQKAEDRGCF